MKLSLIAMLLCIPAIAGAAGTAADENARWQHYARQVHIIRDNWGIAHVYGKSDADAVFGMIYAQAEDDFSRIERNYLISLGRLAQAEGESAVYSDLRARLFIDDRRLQQQYRTAPAWLKSLMDAWSDGLNYFLSKHPNVHASVILHFEPWMALSFTEGSIGGDIETIDLKQLQRFYGQSAPPSAARSNAASAAVAPDSPGGSNGFAIAPKLTASGHAMLWINPHTSYYFRSELQMVSEQGLDVYGAVTWGQFFVYQGFNPHNGWMHTSYGGDAIDEYAEDLVRRSGGLYYRYGTGLKKLRASQVVISVKGAASRSFTVYHSHHGPIIRAENGKWIAIKLLQAPVRALSQSYLAHEDQRLCVLPQDPGYAHRHVQQHGVCGRRWNDRLLPRKFHSQARHLVRFHASGRRQQSGDGMARPACRRGHHYPAESEQWLAFQQQQLAVHGGRRSKSETRKLSALHVDQGRKSARPPRH